MLAKGIFTISLDFELYWGVRDKRSIKAYEKNLLGVHLVIPKILALFREYNIHATWATVGFLMARDFEELERFMPSLKPQYDDLNLSPYKYLSKMPITKKNHDVHFANNLIQEIKKLNTQEVGTHTFSHYYCMENGQTDDEFQADIQAAKSIAKQLLNIELRSIVFPRNQLNKNYLKILAEENILSYRGNPQHWIYNSGDDEDQKNIIKRALRLLDNYVNITGHKTYKLNNNSLVTDIPASSFLRPYNNKLRLVEFLRLRRIKRAMLYAAKNKEIFHLWWHPHNFGINQAENLFFLTKILDYYQYLEKKYSMLSLTMSEIVEIKENF